MKKLTKILVAALVFALLIGTVFAFTVSAADESSQPATASEGPWIVSKNVSYEQNTHLFFAIDASVATDSTKLSLNVLDADGNILAEGLTVSAANQDIYKDGSMIAHIIKTPGVAAKDYVDVLTINVYYDGSAEPVESTTYSVAEYFYERLYKNGVIEATAGEALSQKKLYLASLRYGAAAQKVLTDDTILADELVYVGGDVDSALITSKRLEVPSGIWTVKSYVGDTVVNSVINGGDYFIENSAIINKFETPVYGKNENGTDVSGFEIPEGEESTPWIYDEASDSVLMGYKNYNTNTATSPDQSFYLDPVVKEENGEQYINFNKPKGFNSSTEQGAQTAIVWVKNNDTAGESALTFEIKMRINSLAGNVYFRAYNGGTVTNPSGGTCFASSGAARNVLLTSSNISNATNKSNAVAFGVDTSDWFTLRLDLIGTTLKVYTAPEGGQLEYRGDIDKSTDWAGKDLADATTFVLMNDSTATMDIDVAYSYFGKALEVPEVKETPEITAPKDLNYTFTNSSGSSCAVSAVKNILDGSEMVEVEKTATGNQMNLLYQLNSKNTGTSSAFVLNFDFCWSVPKTAGVSFNSDVLDITLRNESKTRIYRSYLKGSVSGGISIDINGGKGNYVNTGIKLGEWFNIKVLYEATGTAYSADTFKVTYFINGEELASNTAQWGSSYAPACDIYNIGILANGSNKSNVQIKNLEMYFVD